MSGSRGNVRALIAVALVGMAACAQAPVARAADCPWMNTRMPADQRAHLLLGALTLDQKISLVHGGGTSVGKGAGAISGIPELCLPALGLADGAAGLGNGNTGVTAFPAPIAQAAAFDPGQQETFGRALGDEFIAKGENDWLAPNVNIARYPKNGRTFEAYGEDPFLSGHTSAPGIRGVQSRNVIGTVKHYLGNQSETNRFYEDSRIDDRTLHEIYTPAFETSVKEGDVGSVMCAYNRVNGPYACGSSHILEDVLKGEFGFKGFVVSDWVFAAQSVTYANEGLDMEMPFALAFAPLSQAVQAGVVPMARLNDMVFRILFTEFRLGLFDHLVSKPADNVSTPAHRALAQRMSEDGSVLLKNAGDLLPLTAKHQKIAVIGPVDKDGAGNVCTGGGSADIDCTPQPALDAIRARAAKNGDTVVFDDGSDTARAVSVAKTADVALVFGYYNEAEFSNRQNLNLDDGGDDLIAAVAGANKKTVALLRTGGPVLMPWLDQVAGVLQTWYPGVEGAAATAALLFGDANPSGHLPITFPASESDLPTAGSPAQQTDVSPVAQYSEGLLVGYRWYDAKDIKPLFPFGFGLSYTTFRFDDLRIKDADDSAVATFRVTNTGRRAGATVAQAYVGMPEPTGEPPRQLKGYRRVELAPGQSAKVAIPLDARAFSHWATDEGWVVTPGCYTISVGDSSRSLSLAGRAGIWKSGCGTRLTGVARAAR